MGESQRVILIHDVLSGQKTGRWGSSESGGNWGDGRTADGVVGE